MTPIHWPVTKIKTVPLFMVRTTDRASTGNIFINVLWIYIVRLKLNAIIALIQRIHMDGTTATSGGQLLLIEACKKNDIERVKQLLEDGIDPCSVDSRDGTSALMHAAENGDEELVSVLLHAGASYQQQDFENHTAGEYAMGNPNKAVFRLLLEWAVQCEMALGRASLEERERNSAGAPVNREYLESKIYYKDGKILDTNGEAVMMGWEAPLMVRHAKEICKNGGDVCNIGFGMGIIDMEIQGLSPKSHTIIEAHPDVYEHMIQTGWGEKENVKIVFGRWQDVIDDVSSISNRICSYAFVPSN
jgi:protein arginine N-methyltransferase 2